MFEPVSQLNYLRLEPKGQAIVVAPATMNPEGLRERWRMRAAAVVGDDPAQVRDIVRDLLANPQIRAVVFQGDAASRPAWDAFFEGPAYPAWGIDHEHLGLVRQFVDRYDDDFGIKTALQPFWPTRIRYIE